MLFAVCLSGPSLGTQPAIPLSEQEQRAIEAAMPYFNKTGRVRADYDVAVFERDEGVLVFFFNLGAKGWRGCPEQWPNYEVWLQKDRRTFIRAGVPICR